MSEALPRSIGVLVEPRVAEVGGAPVARVLPRVTRRSVGAFVFFDHFGPHAVAAGGKFDVLPHPHIGLATVTYLLSGAEVHRDSLGSMQRIEPGAINLMTAGRGIVHSERSPAEVVEGTVLHGLQFWVGLPQSEEECAPSFAHHPADSIPKWDESGVRWRLLLGEALGRSSPARSPGRPILLEAQLDAGARIVLPSFAAHEERALYGIEGRISIDGFALPAKHLAVLADGDVVVTAAVPSRLALLGGPPLDGPRYLDWNFVSSSKERLAQARADWIARRFPLIPGDDRERIPHPAEAT